MDLHQLDMFYNQRTDVSPLTGPQELLDLPNEILTRIIYYVFAQGYAILPIIKSCKRLYNSFIYLVYLTNVVHIEEFLHLVKRDNSKTTHILKMLNEHKETITSQIPILHLHSSISTIWINKVETQFLTYLPTIVPFASRLVVFNLVLNSTVLLYKVFEILPQKLKVLVLRLEMTRTQLALTSLPLTQNHPQKLSKLYNLEYFEISSHNCEIIVDRYHPELGSRLTPGRISEETVHNDTLLTKLYNVVHSNANQSKVKRAICQLIYRFLSTNGENLLKLEIIGIDMSLIFNKGTQQPFNLPSIRLVSFDNTTSINMGNWIAEFQLINCRPTFKNLSPILLFHDKLTGRLYSKETTQISSRIDPSTAEMSLWRFTKAVFDGYRRIHRVRELDY